MADIIAIIFFFSLSCVVISVSLSYPDKGLAQGGGPGIYPLVLAVFLALLSVFCVVELFVWKQKEEPQEKASKVGKKRYILLCLITVLLIAYWVLLPVLKYPLATFIFIFASICVLGDEMKGWFRIIHGLLYATGFTGFLHLVFQKGLKIPLP